MELDPIEIRLGNYFEYRGTVKEIFIPDLAQLAPLLLELKPTPNTSCYLARLNFHEPLIGHLYSTQKK